MSFSGIESLSNEVFSHLPNLQVLDISKNLLIELKVDVIKPMPALTLLNLKDNSFECNSILPRWARVLKNYTAHNGIKHYENCLIEQHTSKKFERMMVQEEPLRRNGWLYFEEDIEVNENKTNVPCANVTLARKKDNILVHHIMAVIELSPPLFVLFLLVFGFMMGKKF